MNGYLWASCKKCGEVIPLETWDQAQAVLEGEMKCPDCNSTVEDARFALRMPNKWQAWIQRDAELRHTRRSGRGQAAPDAPGNNPSSR